MGEFRPTIIGLLLAGLFAFVLITGGAMLAIQNNSPQSITDDASLADFKEDLNETLTDSYGQAEAADDAFSDSPLSLTSSIPFVDAIGGIWKTLKIAPIAVWNLLSEVILNKILGSALGVVVLGIIGAILIITIIFGVWKMISTGEPG